MGVGRSPPKPTKQGQDRQDAVKKHNQPDEGAVGGSNSVELGKTYSLMLRSQKYDNDESMERNSKCKECSNVVNEKDKGIECDFCKHWYHAHCVGIEASQYKMILKMDFLEWTCKECKNAIVGMREENLKLKNDNKCLLQENQLLMERLAVVEKRMKEIKEEIKDEIIKEVNESVFKVMTNFKETEEKKKRENNLVLYNMEESTKDLGMDREEEDRGMCQKIFADGLKVEHSKYQVKKVIRLGKRREADAKPRPLLVQLSSSEEKWMLLRQAKLLKNYNHPRLGNVVVAPDLTPEEQEKDRELRRQLKIKRDSGERGWMIKNGKIIKQNFIRQEPQNAR